MMLIYNTKAIKNGRYWPQQQQVFEKNSKTVFEKPFYYLNLKLL